VVRVLGIAVIAAMLLATKSAAGPPMTKGEYVQQWRSAAADEGEAWLLERLGAGRAPGCRLCSAKPPASGREWIRAAERFETRTRDAVEELESLRPPHEVVDLHQSWLVTIRGCRDRTLSLVPLAQAETGDILDPRLLPRAADEFAIM
jgi:hypothetical protein